MKKPRISHELERTWWANFVLTGVLYRARHNYMNLFHIFICRPLVLSIQSKSHNSRLFKENNIDPLYCLLWSWASESGSNVHLLCSSHLFKWGSLVAYKIQKPPTAGESFNDTIYIRFIFFPTLFIISFSLGLLCWS